MICASTKYLIVGAATQSFARGFDDDVGVYRDRYPNLSQAHRLPEHASEIDEASFELALSAFLDGLTGVYEKVRSEEHTSELQSRFDLVCRLLLEKKK